MEFSLSGNFISIRIMRLEAIEEVSTIIIEETQ
jgi:hypothetical protein